MSTERKKCVHCSTQLHKDTGKKLDIKSAESADEVHQWIAQLQPELGRLYYPRVAIGDAVCSRCYSQLRLYRHEKAKKIKEQAQAEIPTQTSPICSPPSTQTSSSSQQSDKNDLSVVYKEYTKEKTDDTEIFELPLKRPISTHKHCFICRATKNLVTVSFEARFHVFSSTQIFIPQGILY